MNQIKVIAHRGGYKESHTRENSKEAILYAISKDYVDGVEFDIRITKDKKIVLIHNSSIKYHNKRYKVAHTNYQTLNEIYFKIYHTKLITLEEILAFIPKNKLIFLEIKSISKGLEKENLKLIDHTLRKYPSKKITLLSFLYKYLKYFNEKGYSTCLLISRNSKFFELKTYFKIYLTLYLSMISIHKSMVHKRLVSKILKSNKKLGIYTIEKSEEIDHIFKNIGIEMIKKYQNKIYITTQNPRQIAERIQMIDEEN